MISKRSSGILLHPTSLPGKYGIGTLGKEALEFIDFLIDSGQKLWQVCPLGPTGYGDSPYQCFSAFAGNPMLISIEKLVEEGMLNQEDLPQEGYFDSKRVEYGKVIDSKVPLLKKAFKNFLAKDCTLELEKFERFCDGNKEWLDDFALFMSIKEKFDSVSWVKWPNDIRLREEDAVEKYTKELSESIRFQEFMQWKFFEQWTAIKAYANVNGVKIIGDIPIYVAFDSSDAWANPELFQFDEDRKPVAVAGVPPDYFSATGQLWGNPLYNWEKLMEDNFGWWIKRIQANLDIADIVRIDHFRGFAAYWAVPAEEKTAMNGKWVPAPGKELFEAIEHTLGKLPIIAEDLGVITPDVEELRDGFQLPGMKILQFAFDSEEDSTNFFPHMYDINSVCYTGTHDNDTINGWFKEAKEIDKNHAKEYLNIKTDEINWEFIRSVWASVSVIAIAPMQDLLGLGSESRMNIPGTTEGNWQWRLQEGEAGKSLSVRLKKVTKLYNR